MTPENAPAGLAGLADSAGLAGADRTGSAGLADPDRLGWLARGRAAMGRRPVASAVGVAAVLVAVLWRVGFRPRLWSTAVRQLAHTAGPSWWRRPPFLPLPARRYAAFRVQTMYGGDGRLGEVVGRGADSPLAEASRVADELVGWLAWSARERAALRSRH